MADTPPSPDRDDSPDEGFIELSESTLEAIKAAGRKLDEDVQAGRVESGSSRWVMTPSGDRFCIRHPGPAPESEPEPEPEPESEPRSDIPHRSIFQRWWRRLMSR